MRSRPPDILDLPSNADVDSIKLAYRRMAKLYHPDKVASLAQEFRELAELRMKEINAAYHELLR
ncbi:MAG TPA: DnaJ domain-containing protein [Pyrinomonadaceae bacterium]|nr:DnaJ domain-containing protein [Pyrinomonadaceae bacterium]